MTALFSSGVGMFVGTAWGRPLVLTGLSFGGKRSHRSTTKGDAEGAKHTPMLIHCWRHRSEKKYPDPELIYNGLEQGMCHKGWWMLIGANG